MTQGIRSFTFSLQKACTLASPRVKTHQKRTHTHKHAHTHDRRHQTATATETEFFFATVLQRPRAQASGLSAQLRCRVWSQACVVCGPAGPGKASVSRRACGMRVSALLRTPPEKKNEPLAPALPPDRTASFLLRERACVSYDLKEAAQPYLGR